MSTHEKKLQWCLARETRMKTIPPNKKLSEDHILTAKSFLKFFSLPNTERETKVLNFYSRLVYKKSKT